VSTLSSLVGVLNQLVQVLQAQAQAGTLGGGPGGAQQGAAQVGDPTQQTPSQSPAQAGGCGCGGASGALQGNAQQLSETKQDAPPTPPAPDNSKKPPSSPDTAITAKKGTREYNAQVVAKVAREFGVDPVLAVADAITESNLDNTNKTGDGGSSFGLFQLHKGGELPKDWYPGQPNAAKAFDPEANARVALSRFRALKGQYSGASLAYHAQRPADEAGYERSVNSHMAEARKLLGM
jgi:hypothetical protein